MEDKIIWVLLLIGLLFLVCLITLMMIRREIKKLSRQWVQKDESDRAFYLTIKDYESRTRSEINQTAQQNRTEINNAMRNNQEVMLSSNTHFHAIMQNQLDALARQMEHFMQVMENHLEQIRRTLADQLQVLNRDTVQGLKQVTESMERKLEHMNERVELQIKELQQDSNRQLEQIRMVVDEKLHATLEQRLGESFKLVSERLESVHKGLGEMQSLAVGVGDLKKVLTNVKTRGTWGEVQLGNILADILTPNQYEQNVAVKGGSERVEYAVKMPGPDKDLPGIWLPLDAKFPLEDYYRLLEAYELAEPTVIETAAKALEQRIKNQAKEIADKYIEPPQTTDFAILFLPTESLYAEVLRRPGLLESIRRDYHVTVAGPTTLAAIITSLAVGFKTLAIQQRTSEVWQVLGVVKREFLKFGSTLDKTQKKLQEASHTIEEAAKRSRLMERKLKDVEVPYQEQAYQNKIYTIPEEQMTEGK